MRDPRIRRLRYRDFAGVSRGRLPRTASWLQERVASLADTGTPIEFSVAPALDGSFTCIGHSFLSGNGPVLIGSDVDGVAPISFSSDSSSTGNVDGSALPSGLLRLQEYWVQPIDANNFYLSPSRDGMKSEDNLVTPADLGTGHLYIVADGTQAGIISFLREGVKSAAITVLTTLDNMLGLLR